MLCHSLHLRNVPVEFIMAVSVHEPVILTKKAYLYMDIYSYYTGIYQF